jgi:trimethylamine--corrinoid protein Co-methyltransferase
MRLIPYLNDQQVALIHRNALRVLAEVGVRVEHEGVRARLAEVGGYSSGDIVTFPAPVLEQTIAATPKHPLDESSPIFIDGEVGVFHSYYLDPETNYPLPFTEERFARYIGLAHRLPRVGNIGMLGVPFPIEGIPPEYAALAEKLVAWRHGFGAGGSVHFTGLCEPLLELFSCHANYTGKTLPELFTAVGYLVSPLKLARPECEQLLFFAERGLNMYIGHLPSQGGTAPVSFAGALTLALAEQMFLFMLGKAFRGQIAWSVYGSLATMEVRRALSCYGRPEQQRTNLAFIDIARFYGCHCSVHSGLSDAKVPSVEAGAQKAIGALMAALTTGYGSVSAGLLSMDEVCSPVQLVLDDDLIGALRALVQEPVVDEIECAFDEITAAGPGGNHLGTDFTFDRYRNELFQPRTWSQDLINGWLGSGQRTDVDFARDYVQEFEREFTFAPSITEEEERELRAIITHAVKAERARW